MDLSSRAMITRLSIKGAWSAVTEDEEISAEVARNHNVDKSAGRYMKKLLDPKKVPSLKNFKSARTTLYNLHRALTLAWDDKGGRMLPAAMYFDYMTKIGEAKQRMTDAYDVFLKEIPALKLRAQTDPETAGLFRDDDWPDPAELGQKIDVRVRITPLADASDFRVQLGDDEVAKIKTQVTNDLFQSLAGSLGEFVGRIKTAVLDTKERLDSYAVDADGKTVRTFRDSAITNLRELVAMIPKLNVVQDPTLAALAQEIETSLCRHDPQDLRDNFLLRKDAVTAATSIADKLAAIEDVLSTKAA